MTGVVLAVAPGAEDAIAAAVASHPELTLVRRCADLAEALATVSAGVATVAVLSPQPHLDLVTLGEFAHMGVRVIGVASDDADIAALTALGMHVENDSDPLGIADAAATAPLAARVEVAPEPMAAAGIIIAVWGPTGAPGRTSIAVNLAAALSEDRTVLVVDVDTYGASVAQTLALPNESPGIAAVARAAVQGEADAAAIRRHAVRANERLAVLTGLPRPGRWAEVSAAAVKAAWPAMRTFADVTIVDCGFGLPTGQGSSRRDDATVAALAEADIVVAVGAAEPVGMQRLVDALAELADVAPEARSRAMILVNRVRASVAGPQPERQVADALARYAGVAAVWTVPWDQRTADLAALRGSTWFEVAPRSPAARAVRKLAEAVNSRCDGIDIADTPGRSSAVAVALTD